jgi:Predicted transcriptional regulator
MNVYESLLKGLQEAVEYEKGNIALKTNTYSVADLENFSAKDIKQIRKNTGLSQTAFGLAMGVSKKAVEAWESGRNKPVGPAKRILVLVEEDPLFFERNSIIEREPAKEAINSMESSISEEIQLVSSYCIQSKYAHLAWEV